MVALSIIIPVLNEAHSLEENLSSLHGLLEDIKKDKLYEVILVDGGSTDATIEIASAFNNSIVTSKVSGRAAQMNMGAKMAKGQMLLFLHGDTRLPFDFFSFLNEVKKDEWGFFLLKLSGKAWIFRIIERCINFRSSLTAVATGDQGIFVGRQLFSDLKGYADLPLMEDVEITKRLRKISSPTVIPKQIVTSSRRWEKRGVLTTVLLMWRLRLSYFLGVSPHVLAKQYYGASE